MRVDWHQDEDQLHVYALLPTREGGRAAATLVESLHPESAAR